MNISFGAIKVLGIQYIMLAGLAIWVASYAGLPVLDKVSLLGWGSLWITDYLRIGGFLGPILMITFLIYEMGKYEQERDRLFQREDILNKGEVDHFR